MKPDINMDSKTGLRNINHKVKPGWSFKLFHHRERPSISKEQLRAYEERVLRGTADTFRTLHEHPTFEVNNIDLAQEIENKVVGDLGSGLGGLAKSAFVEGIPTEVFSFNPSLDRQEFKQAEVAASTGELRKHYPGISDRQIQEAQTKHDENLILAFAYDLQPVKDEFFDLLVDTVAIHAYFRPEDEAIYEMSIKEMLRVLRPGGKILIEDGFRWGIGHRDDQGQPLFKERVLQKLGVRYEVLYEGDRASGAIIYKD